MRKIIMLSVILLFIIIPGLFALDLFVLTVPEWVIYAFLGVMIALTVLLFIKQKKKAPRIACVVLSVLTAAAIYGGIYADPYFNSVNFHSDAAPSLPYDTPIPADKAKADLDYAIHYFTKLHPSILENEGRYEPVLRAAEEMKTAIGAAGSVTVNELTAIIERTFSRLGDAHTNAYTEYSDILYLKHYYKWRKDGFRISAVNGLTISDLLVKSRELFSFEAESWELHQFKNRLVELQGLDYLGFSVSDGITYTFTNDVGEEYSETYFPEDYVTYAEYIAFNGTDSTKNSRESSFVGFTIDEEKSLALLRLDECIYNDEYINCVRDMFTQVKQKGIKSVAVDLRDNGGGNSNVADEFIKYLDTDSFAITTYSQRLGPFMTPVSDGHIVNERYTDLTFTGNVYILTSSGSFSSAMLFSEYIKDNGLGKIIGEAPGNNPNGYGEIGEFRTPNAGIYLSISTKRFYRADRSCGDDYVMPDIACEADSALDTLYDLL